LATDQPPACRLCRHFTAAPAALARALPGIASLSSAYGAFRADDGVCAHHGRHVRAGALCGAFLALGEGG